MIYMAFVGAKEHRYNAEKTFAKPPQVGEVKTFETYRSFFNEVKRENHSLHTAVICIPNCQFEELKKQILEIEPKANVIHYRQL